MRSEGGGMESRNGEWGWGMGMGNGGEEWVGVAGFQDRLPDLILICLVESSMLESVRKGLNDPQDLAEC